MKACFPLSYLYQMIDMKVYDLLYVFDLCMYTNYVCKYIYANDHNRIFPRTCFSKQTQRVSIQFPLLIIFNKKLISVKEKSRFPRRRREV